MPNYTTYTPTLVDEIAARAGLTPKAQADALAKLTPAQRHLLALIERMENLWQRQADLDDAQAVLQQERDHLQTKAVEFMAAELRRGEGA